VQRLGHQFGAGRAPAPLFLRFRITMIVTHRNIRRRYPRHPLGATFCTQYARR
jgi:hypothetical protein